MYAVEEQKGKKHFEKGNALYSNPRHWHRYVSTETNIKNFNKK